MNPPQEAAPENPRTRRVRELMLATATDILLSSGPQHVTAARVAEQADVARTTVYRQWPDQRSLLLATVEARSNPIMASSPDGPVETDVRTACDQLRKRLEKRQVRAVFGALAGQAAQDNTFRDAQRLFVQQLSSPMKKALDAAVDRGELDESTDTTLEATMLAGPLLHVHLALHDKITDDLINEVVERWLRSHS